MFLVYQIFIIFEVYYSVHLDFFEFTGLKTNILLQFKFKMDKLL
jgi:hypothetical protein